MGQQVVHHHIYVPAKSGGTAALLEVLPGLLIQTFGIGHMYAGNVLTGLLIMLGYWILLGINVVLCFLLIGLVTLPLTWLGFLILSPIIAAQACSGR